MKQSVVTEPGATIIVTEGEISPNQPYDLDIAVPKGATHALMLVERLSGQGSITVDLSGLTADELGELSRLQEVRLRFRRVAFNAEHVALRVTTSAKALFRVTVAFIKGESSTARKHFKCRTCKVLCRLAVSALLAHLGIPYLDAEPPVSMPQIDGQPVAVGEACRAMLEKPGMAPSWVREMFELIDPKAMLAVWTALEVLDGLLDASDRLYTSVCQILRMCPAKPG